MVKEAAHLTQYFTEYSTKTESNNVTALKNAHLINPRPEGHQLMQSC